MKRNGAIILAAGLLAILAAAAPALAQKPKPKYTKAPGADLRQEILWGSEATGDGLTLSFGGINQRGDDPRPHTRIRKGEGEWKNIAEELQKANPQQAACEQARAKAEAIKAAVAKIRFAYLDGDSKAIEAVRASFAKFTDEPVAAADLDGPELVKTLYQLQVSQEKQADLLAAEPSGRCLSPLVWEPKSKVFVLFGGDHLDYMTNDTWVFDPAKMRWEQRHPKIAPAPRANHTLTATGDGKIKLSGGFGHNNIDIWYMGPLYQLVDDGDWVYDVAANTWTSESGAEGVEPNQRAYRTMKFFDPQAFVEAGGKPDREANEKKLAALPANTWVSMDPPLKPKMNRDWGSACIAPEFDVLLRWSGGHSAHGGSDVPMYHFATNRWEFPYPVEFPLGQTYSNTSYPNGFNLNHRPWVSGHTYKNFGWDPVGKVMVFTGHNPWSYLFSPAVADWTGRTRKPESMNYGGSFYTLTLCTAGERLYSWGGRWGNDVSLCLWQPKERTWEQVKVTGASLGGPAVDHSGMVYDSKRDRLIFIPKKYTDKLQTLDCKTKEAAELSPAAGNATAGKFSFWRELAYLPEADAVVVLGQVLRPGDPKTGPVVNLAYDCAANKWIGLQFEGKHPVGNRDVSAGTGYDAKRKLVWYTNTNSDVWAIRPQLDKAKKVELE